MALLICAPDRSNERLASDLRRLLPQTDIRIWPDVGEATDIEFAVLWKHPAGLVQQLPNLRALSSLGAGIEHLVNDADIPHDLAIGRLAGPQLANDMATWLVGRVIAHCKDFRRFDKAQQQKSWAPWAPDKRPTIGILGMGQMGQTAASAFQSLGFEVFGWARTSRPSGPIPLYNGIDGLDALLTKADALICLLPLTPHTRGILNKDLMAKMPKHSLLINVGRGAHLVEDDLLEALETDQPGHAILDVFGTEPLPTEHPFWSHPKITISPHCAALTDPAEAAKLLAESYQAVMRGLPPLGQVNLTEGY